MALSILVAGGGKVGTYLAQILIANGHTVRILEGDKKELERLQKEIPHDIIYQGNPTKPDDLIAAGIRKTDVVAAVRRSDEENLVISSLAKFEFRVPKTIARVNIPKNSWLFTREMGVDVTVNQADFMAHLIAREMSLGDMMTLFKLQTGAYSLVENTVHKRSIASGKAISDLNLPEECILSAIIREDTLVIPRGHTILLPGDEILAVVHESVMHTIEQMFKEPVR